MSLNMSKYEVEHIPTPPLISKPKREEFCNNADWGAALDQWEAEVEERKQQVEEIRKKNTQCNTRAYEQFCKDLMEDLGWDWMTPKQFQKAMEYACERGHSAGLSEVYSQACELDELLQEFRSE